MERQTGNVRYDHVTMFILYLPFAVFSLSVKSSIFALASKARISLHSLFQESIDANLTAHTSDRRGTDLQLIESSLACQNSLHNETMTPAKLVKVTMGAAGLNLFRQIAC